MENRLNFRVWDKRKNNYIKDFVFNFINKFPYITVEYFDNEYEYTHTFAEDEIIIEQCTELIDINGNLIYEGDIVRYHGDIGLVIYSRELLCWGLVFHKADYCIYGEQLNRYGGHLTRFKIIGNVHENRDLIEDED